MKLSRLVEGLDVAPADVAATDGAASDPDVSGIVHDSRRAAPGALFVAWKGQRFDGTAFAANAATAGAVAVVAAHGSPRPAGVPADVPWLTAADPHRLLAPLAARLHGHPDREMLTAGVTGTNGKSTVATLLASIFDAAGRTSGLLGSLGYRLGTRLFDKGRTTPEASDLFRLLRVMRDEGAQAIAMEVSSHALALGRVEGMGFDLGVFTNLTRDHLDFHRDFEDYFQAKKRLFGMLKSRGAVASTGMAAVNVDDPYGARLAAELPAERVLTWGAAAGDVRPLAVDLHVHGMDLRLATPRGELEVASPLLGSFNLLNVLAAVAGAEALGLPPAAIQAGVADVQPLPGRMQPVEAGQPFPVYVDYSHTPQALEAALQAVRELAHSRVLVVFGCGGDRDAGKRPQMGKIAGELAEIPILTSDNPRTEDPMRILAAVEEGVKESGNESYRVVPDRREAIRLAMELADAGSLVLIAGKGDEPVQIVGGEELPFFDYDEAVKALESKYGGG